MILKVSSNLADSLIISFSCRGERRRAAHVPPLSLGIPGKQEREGRVFRGYRRSVKAAGCFSCFNLLWLFISC